MIMPSRRNFILLAALGTAAVPVLAKAQTPLAERLDGVAPYLDRMLALGRLSTQASQLATEKATDEDIVAFAEAEILEQETLTAILGVSNAAGDLERPLPADATNQIERLSGSEGSEFDLAYLEGQIALHEQLREAGDSLAADDELSLETVAAKVSALTIAAHLLALNLLQQKLGAERIEGLEARGEVTEPAS